MVRLVDDDQADALDAFPALRAGQRPDAGDDDVGVLVLVSFGLDDADVEVRGDGTDLGSGLLDEFVAVGDDESADAAGVLLGGEVGEDHGLTAAGGEQNGET